MTKAGDAVFPVFG